MCKKRFAFLFSIFLLMFLLIIGNRLRKLDAQDINDEKDTLFGMLHKDNIEVIAKVDGCTGKEYSFNKQDKKYIIRMLKKIEVEEAEEQGAYYSNIYGGYYLFLKYKDGEIDSIRANRDRIIYKGVIYKIKQWNEDIHTFISEYF